jgi:hypothetical protein
MNDLIARLRARLECVDDRWAQQLEAVANAPDNTEELGRRLFDLRKLSEQSQQLHQLIHYHEHKLTVAALQQEKAS